MSEFDEKCSKFMNLGYTAIFHNDWNYLIFVIKEIDERVVLVDMNGIKDSYVPYLNAKRGIKKELYNLDREGVIREIDKYLDWYNKQKES